MCSNGGMLTNCIMLSVVTTVEDERSRGAVPAGLRVPGLYLHVDGLANTPWILAFKSWIVSHPLKTMGRAFGHPGAAALGLTAGQRLQVQRCLDS